MTEPATTDEAQRPGRPAAEKHDKCPLCGHPFNTPKARCSNRKACEARQRGEGRGQAQTAAQPGAAAKTSGKAEKIANIEKRAAARRQSDKGEGVPAGERAEQLGAELNNPTPLRVKLTSKGQEALITKLFPADQQRSGLAGHWFLLFDDERTEAELRLVAASDPSLDEAKAGTDASMARTIIEKVQEADEKRQATA